MFCSNSPHKNWYKYQIIGTMEPLVLSKTEAIKMIQYIDGICNKHGLTYRDRKTGINPHLKKMIKSLKISKDSRFCDT